MAKKIIYEGINAVFTLDGPFGEIVKGDRKAVVLACLLEGGEWFRTARIPLRFTNFAYQLGYRVSEKWKKEKRHVLRARQANPFIGITNPGGGDAGSLVAKVINPEKMAIAMEQGCRVEASGTSAGGNIFIRTPYGHPILAAFAEVMKTVTDSEYQQIAQQVAGALNAFLASGVKPSAKAKRLTIPGANDGWNPRGRQYEQRDHGHVSFRGQSRITIRSLRGFARG